METNFLDIKALFGQFDRTTYSHRGPFKAKLDSYYGNGVILQIMAGAGIECYVFDLRFKQDTILKVPVNEEKSIYGLNVVKGSCRYLSGRPTRSVFFDHFQTHFTTSQNFVDGSLYVAGGQRIHFLLIALFPETFASKYPNYGELLDKLKESITRHGTPDAFFYKLSHDLSSCEQIKGLQVEAFDAPSQILNAEIICKQILAAQLEAFRSEINGEVNRSYLSVREMQGIVEEVEWIKQNLGQVHSVTELSRKSGISPNKLQLGFKTIYGHTVSGYIRNLRLQRAEFLIRTTDLNISEVVYTIGLTSRSYFCKIFKRKYDCAPKQYKNMVWQQPQKKAVPGDPLSV